MPTDVVMPQMGESIAEGTIVRWIKKVGDKIDRDEPLFEISTDKVDAEIPSPGAGVLTEIKVKEGETVPVNSVVAVIAAEGEAPAASAASALPEAAVGQPETGSGLKAQGSGEEGSGLRAQGSEEPAQSPTSAGGPLSKEDLRRQKSSPLVRRIAKDNNVDISTIRGTGISGRGTKNDILGLIESGGAKAPAAPAPQAAPPRPR